MTLRRRAGATAAASLLAGLGLLGAAAPAGAGDPFYERQAAEGAAAAERGDFSQAVRDLTRAAFGLLDEPPALAAVLVRLALAQAGAGDADGFAATFRRLTEVETRFGAYRAADLPAAVRQRFEERAAATIPLDELAAVEAFREIVRVRRTQELARLPPAERRTRLAALAAAEPGEVRWPLAQAELEIAEARWADAIAKAEAALALVPDDERARCLRGTARAFAGTCDAAVLDLASCAAARSERRAAEGYLGCLTFLGRWDVARHLLADLPAALRAEKKIAQLERRVERQAREEGPSAEKAADAAQVPKPAGPQPAAAPTAAGPPALPETDRAILDRVRTLSAQAKTAGELDEPLRLVGEVADRHPTVAEAQWLAGEVSYRASRWPEAARYFDRAGPPDPARPELSFYMSIALFEIGEPERARTILREALPRLRRTPYVETTIRRILGETP